MVRRAAAQLAAIAILCVPASGRAAVVSVSDVLLHMTSRILLMEERGIQVRGTTIGFVSRVRNTFQIPITLTQGEETVFVGVGDSSRILDLDLVVTDQRGKEVARDTLSDNVPVVKVMPTYTGTYVVQVVGSSLAEGLDDGFFGFVQGVAGPDGAVVSIADTLAAASLMASYVESQDYQVEGAQWISVAARTDAAATIDLTGGSTYLVMGIGAPSRIRDLDLTVKGPDGAVLGSDKKKDNSPLVPVTAAIDATYTVVVRAASMEGRADDGQALVLWARRVGDG